MWVLLIVFLLLSDRIGWCIWVFLVVAGAMLLALAVKLSWIVRYTSRARVPDEISGKPHDLDPEAFFFRRPWLMLPPIKLLLFFVSLVRERERGWGLFGSGEREKEKSFLVVFFCFFFFFHLHLEGKTSLRLLQQTIEIQTNQVWSNALFFSANFGRRSCFFSRRGLCFFISFFPNQKPEKQTATKKLTLFFYPTLPPHPNSKKHPGLQSIPVSWWGVVVASVLMFVALAVNVMPAYSICVHLGLDHKPHLLPSDEHREHFRQVAEERRKEAEEKEKLARSSSSSSSSGARAKRQQLQKMVSRRLPRQSDLSAAAPSRSVSSEHHH